MLIRIGFEIVFDMPLPSAMVLMLYVHPSRADLLMRPERVDVEPDVPVELYTDSFGNRCGRILAPAGRLRLSYDNTIRDSGMPDRVCPAAREVPVAQLPPEVLQYLLPSRYCEVDLLNDLAWQLFGQTQPGWPRVQAICDWVHQNVRFGYPYARATRTASEVYQERQGVCRDFQHLAITFCRCMNIPARYATGYLGDIGVPPVPDPMDFSAWFEAYLDGEWFTFDARHNYPRIGRVLMAVGRDAADVALTTSFGVANLEQFTVWTDEVAEAAALDTGAVLAAAPSP